VNYKAHYESLMLKARLRKVVDGYFEEHHIVPRCLGGGDESENLINLTAEEHYVAHQLLVKMHPKSMGLAAAALLMSSKDKKLCRSGNKVYGWLRIRCSKLQSEIMLGHKRRLGKKHSDQTKLKMSISQKLRHQKSGACVSRIPSDVVKKRRSELLSAHWKDYLAKLEDAGVTAKPVIKSVKWAHSSNGLEGIRKAQTGRKHTEEHKAKVSLAAKLQWQRRREALQLSGA